ncbi:MAG: cell division topological specificity factor MinE [Defluviitaleaceae bacterium]|nr:cell division topological specificity factor MinE [Defluviitaleaceae bacterium]
MLNIFGANKKTASKNVAKERLKLVLITDRIKASDPMIELLKADIMEVISKYVEIGEDEVDLSINNEDLESGEGASTLSATIPIKSFKSRI